MLFQYDKLSIATFLINCLCFVLMIPFKKDFPLFDMIRSFANNATFKKKFIKDKDRLWKIMMNNRE